MSGGLRDHLSGIDVGFTIADCGIAETGTLVIDSNSEATRLVTTLPWVHVALVGPDKLLPSLKEAPRILKVLPRNATGQA